MPPPGPATEGWDFHRGARRPARVPTAQGEYVPLVKGMHDPPGGPCAPSASRRPGREGRVGRGLARRGGAGQATQDGEPRPLPARWGGAVTQGRQLDHSVAR